MSSWHRQEVVSILRFYDVVHSSLRFRVKQVFSTLKEVYGEEARCAGLPANYSASLYLPHSS
jgi:hypothetical protein